jgi:hypothetical protein
MFARYAQSLTVVLLTTSLTACRGAAATPTADAKPGPAAPALVATAAAPTVAPQPTAPSPTEALAATPLPEPTSAPAPAPIAGDANAIIAQALRNQLTSGPFRAKTTITSKVGGVDSPTVNGSSEFVPPNRLRITINNEGTSIEQLHIDGKSWFKAGGKWQPSKTPTGAANGVITPAFVESMVATITEAKLLGPETLDGRAVLALSYTADLSKMAGGGLDVKQQVNIWVGADDNRLYKQEIVSADGGSQSVTTQVIEYDPSITIEAP